LADVVTDVLPIKRYLRRSVDLLLPILLIVTAWRYFDSRPISRENEQGSGLLGLGARLVLPTVDWSLSRRHVVLFLRTTCPACNESVPFYRRLFEHLENQQVSGHIVVSEPTDVVQAWLANNGVRAPNIVTIDRAGSFGVFLVPTIVLVDDAGVVLDVAVEKLDAELESRLLLRVAGQTADRIDITPFAEEISVPEFVRHSKAAGAFWIDVRSRDEFFPKKDVLNMPSDELRVLAPLQVPAGATVAIDCPVRSLTKCRVAGVTLRGMGYDSTVVIR
jgi:Redoxin